MNFEDKLHNVETELVELFFALKEQVEEMDKKEEVSRPDYRYLENRLNELKHLICNNFGYGMVGDSIEKYTEDKHLINAMKLADKYKK